MAIAIIIVLLVIGSLIFHFVSPWWFTPLASNWSSVDDTINIALWITGFVFVAVNLFLAYVVFKYRYHKNRRADYQPENSKLESLLTIITSIGVVAMLAPGLYVWGQFIDAPKQSAVVEVVGQQWHWSFRLPGSDKKLGKTAISLINENNPLGLHFDDPDGQDDLLITRSELHIPVDTPIKIVLRSKDVLHNFAVPQFRVKMDLVPGTETSLWFKATKTGRFEILCEELCGVAHYTMRSHIIVDNQEDYQHWLAQQSSFAQSLAKPLGDVEKGRQLYAACTACHGEQGQGSEAMNAPVIAGLSAWYLTRQLAYFQAKIRGSNLNDVPGQQMQAMASSLPDQQAITDVSSYLTSLAVPNLAKHDSTAVALAKGEQLYTTCAYCHGKEAQGNYAMNAPKLSGQHPWYLKRQIIAYQQGLRGKHRQDLYGNQMRLMSSLLHDEQAIDAVSAYISTLSPNKAQQLKPATKRGMK